MKYWFLAIGFSILVCAWVESSADLALTARANLVFFGLYVVVDAISMFLRGKS